MEYIYMLKKLWKYSEEEKWKVIVYLVLHVISILGSLGQPYAFAMVINALQENNDTVILEVLHWLGIYIICFFIFEIFHRSARFIERYVAFRSRKRFILEMYDILQSLSLRWHSENHSGNIIDRVNKAATALYYFDQSQAEYVNIIITFIGSVGILFYISPIICIVSLVTGILLVLITKYLYKLSVPQYRLQNEGFHKVAATLLDYIKNITTIIVLRLGKYVQHDLENSIDKVFPYMKKENYITQIKCFINSFLVMILNVGLIFYYIYSNSNQGSGMIIKIGFVTAIFQYLRSLMSCFDFYATEYETIIHWKTDFEAVDPIIKTKVFHNEKHIEKINSWKEIDVDKFSFSYGDNKAGLDDISIKLKSGQKIAFVGESGAGKSTVLKILRGLILIENGSIKVDNLQAHMSSLANITTFIPQEPEIFENTIRYNITMGLSATQEEIEKSAKIAGFDSVVSKLPKGYDTDIRENGVNLSGGEKQRLALARGILSVRDSSLVLLDEPTGSLDPITEKQVYTKIFNEMPDKCIVSVLHRLHLLNMFDYIYVFDKGRIVEHGTFNELCNKNGEFSKLWEQYKNNNEDME